VDAKKGLSFFEVLMAKKEASGTECQRHVIFFLFCCYFRVAEDVVQRPSACTKLTHDHAMWNSTLQRARTRTRCA
jgi:hypothetical protein